MNNVRRSVAFAALLVTSASCLAIAGCSKQEAEDPNAMPPGGKVVGDAGGTMTPGGGAPTLEPKIAKKRNMAGGGAGAPPPGPAAPAAPAGN